jgi:ectoine hydroxylase-related dioxygenase (phytanoyl-CoA dioxygenase family)
MGLHTTRIKLSNLCQSIRCFNLAKIDYHKKLKKDGIIAIPNFLEKDEFLILQKEIKNACKDVENKISLQSDQKGFSKKYFFENGFDRYDGSTLNRFIDIDDKSTPASHLFIQNKLLQQIYTHAIGCFHKPSKFSIYQTIYQKQEENPDIQSILHRDTFQPALKFWYFTEDVNQDDGAFEYILGSHILDKNRMTWEKQRSIKASRPTNDPGGAFRLSEEERLLLGQGCSILKSFVCQNII